LEQQQPDRSGIQAALRSSVKFASCRDAAAAVLRITATEEPCLLKIYGRTCYGTYISLSLECAGYQTKKSAYLNDLLSMSAALPSLKCA